jgi:hypothetical protein
MWEISYGFLYADSCSLVEDSQRVGLVEGGENRVDLTVRVP